MVKGGPPAQDEKAGVEEIHTPADVTQASEQATSREFLTKHRFKEP